MRDVLQQSITIMNVKEYQKVIYPSEVVVYDSSGRRVVACPTEQEADEYIEEKVKWNVGSIIRQLRRDKNMTIDELSEAVGKSVSHITQVEEGTRRISIDLLYALVTELDTDANTILAIQNKQGNISVDEELRKLSPEMRTYFSQQFVQMIKEIPN